MRKRVPAFRSCAEIVVTLVAGFVVAEKSCWFDPDEGVSLWAFPALLVLGLLLGLLGRSPVLAVVPATAIVAVLAALGDMYHYDYYGFSAEAAGFYVMFFSVMAAVVLVGAAGGRGVKRYWIRRRLDYAA